MQRLSHLFLMVLSFSAFALFSGQAHAQMTSYPDYLNTAAKNLYGSSASFSFSCNGCHGQTYDILVNGTGFGKAVRAAAISFNYPTTSMTASQIQDIVKYLEAADSDGDGATNKQEFMAGTNPGDPNSVPVLCQLAKPSIAISPSSQTGAPGASLNYSVTIKNQNSASCASASYSLASSADNGLAVSLAMQSVVLSSGQSTSVSVSVSSQLGLADSSLSFSISAVNPADSANQASISAIYAVLNPVPVCTVSAPSLSISPSSQSDFAGASLNYQAVLKNMDSADCAASTFNLSLNSASSLSGTLSMNALSLSPGQSASVNIAMQSALNSLPGSYNFSVQSSDALVPAHSIQASAAYIVKSPIDSIAPSAPTNVSVTAGKRSYNVAWDAAPAADGVVKYSVYVDGVLRSQVTTNSAVLRLRRGSHSITVTASDAAGNESLASSAVVVQVGK
ncbi:MAG: hypothetical protein ACXVCP_09695 [Bdellovibrio sp.]